MTQVLDFVPIFKQRKVADIAVRELANHHTKQGAILHAFVVLGDGRERVPLCGAVH